MIQANWIYDSKNLNLVWKEILVLEWRGAPTHDWILRWGAEHEWIMCWEQHLIKSQWLRCRAWEKGECLSKCHFALSVPHIPFFCHFLGKQRGFGGKLWLYGGKVIEVAKILLRKGLLCIINQLFFVFAEIPCSLGGEYKLCVCTTRSKHEEVRRDPRAGPRCHQRRSLNFRFRSTPPIFGHRPQYGSEAAGQWAQSRSKCNNQNCPHSLIGY